MSTFLIHKAKMDFNRSETPSLSQIYSNKKSYLQKFIHIISKHIFQKVLFSIQCSTFLPIVWNNSASLLYKYFLGAHGRWPMPQEWLHSSPPSGTEHGDEKSATIYFVFLEWISVPETPHIDLCEIPNKLLQYQKAEKFQFKKESI